MGLEDVGVVDVADGLDDEGAERGPVLTLAHLAQIAGERQEAEQFDALGIVGKPELLAEGGVVRLGCALLDAVVEERLDVALHGDLVGAAGLDPLLLVFLAEGELVGEPAVLGYLEGGLDGDGCLGVGLRLDGGQVLGAVQQFVGEEEDDGFQGVGLADVVLADDLGACAVEVEVERLDVPIVSDGEFL